MNADLQRVTRGVMSWRGAAGRVPRLPRPPVAGEAFRDGAVASDWNAALTALMDAYGQRLSGSCLQLVAEIPISLKTHYKRRSSGRTGAFESSEADRRCARGSTPSHTIVVWTP